MIGNIKLTCKLKNKEKDSCNVEEFNSKNIETTSLDGFKAMTINHFSMKPVFKDFKRKLSLIDKASISKMLLFINSNYGNVKEASISFISDSGVEKLNIDLLKEKKDMEDLLSLFELKGFTNAGYIFVANFALMLITAVSVFFLDYGTKMLDGGFNGFSVSLIFLFVVAYGFILPIPMFVYLVKNKIRKNIMYFDSRFVEQWAVFPLLFCIVGFFMSFLIDFSLYLLDFNLKSSGYLIFSLITESILIYFVADSFFKAFKKKFSDPFLLY